MSLAEILYYYFFDFALFFSKYLLFVDESHVTIPQEYEKAELTNQIEKEMLEAAQALDFEKAAFFRDQLPELKDLPELVVNDKKKLKGKAKK